MYKISVSKQLFDEFKQNGFNVEVFCISAPALFTELGYHNRYQEEVNLQGWGRLAEKDSHDKAVFGLLDSLDILYDEKIVEKIHLYTYLAKKHIDTYVLQDNNWNIQSYKPSLMVEETRELQLKNKDRIEDVIQRGISTFKEIESKYKSNVDNLLSELIEILQNLQCKRGFKR